MARTILIIGGGVGGLAAAVRLAANGAGVILCEKNPCAGGTLNQWIAPHPHRPNDRPFVFDTGPTLLTLPLVLADLFAAAGRDVRDYLSIRRIDPASRFVWNDGQSFELRSDPAALREQVRKISPQDVAGFERFLNFGKQAWDLTGEPLLLQSPTEVLRLNRAFSPIRGLKAIRMSFRIGMFRTFAGVVNRNVKHPRLREVLYQYAARRGVSPFLAPAALAAIPHVELAMGRWHVEGGLYRIAVQLEKLARELGVEIRLNSPVERVLVESAGKDRKVSGVRLADGEILPAGAIMMNAASRPKPGAMILLLGIEGTYPQLAHYTSCMLADSCIEVCAGTRTEPVRAPDGCETLAIFVAAPPREGAIDWAIEGPRYRDRIVRTLEERFGLTGLSQRIVVEKSITPASLCARVNVENVDGKQTSPRPPDRGQGVNGLFFANGVAPLGDDLPLAALSAKVASRMAIEYLA